MKAIIKTVALPFAALLLAALNAIEALPLLEGAQTSNGTGAPKDMVRFPIGANITIDISVGTPPQTVTVKFDATTSEFICASSYNPSQSSSYKDLGASFDLPYGLVAKLSTDMVDLGSGPVKQKFGWNGDVSSRIGLSMGKNASTRPGPIENLLGTLNSSIIGFHFTSGAELTIGGVDESKFTGPINYFPPALDSGVWSVQVDTLQVGNTTVIEIPPSVGIIDTLSKGMSMPSTVTYHIHSQIPGSELIDTHIYTTSDGETGVSFLYSMTCDPSSIPPISFVIGGQAFAINPKDIITRNPFRPEYCWSLIGGYKILNRTASEWYLGRSFLNNVYTSFNYSVNSVGFAPLA